MFINNKYSTIYHNFINNRKSRKSLKTDFYELHHIIPKSLGGDNSESNLVKLTPREHFFAHLLLAKTTSGEDSIKMGHALRMMSGITKTKNIINSRQYELSRSVIYNILRSAGKDYQEEKNLQNSILSEYSDLNKILERGVCKSCGVRPKAINYIRNEKTFYRSKCDVCLTGKNEFKLPRWKKDGYSKNKSCEVCGFTAKFTEQLTVIIEDRKYKTICLNCQMEAKIADTRLKLSPSTDF